MSKPYEETRKALWGLHASLLADAQSDRGQENWHLEQAQAAREQAERHTAEAKAIEHAARALEALDSSNITFGTSK